MPNSCLCNENLQSHFAYGCVGFERFTTCFDWMHHCLLDAIGFIGFVHNLSWGKYVQFNAIFFSLLFFCVAIHFVVWDYDKTANINLQRIVIIPIYLLPRSIQVFCFKAFQCYKITFYSVDFFILEISKDITSTNDFYSKVPLLLNDFHTISAATKPTDVHRTFLNQFSYNFRHSPYLERSSDETHQKFIDFSSGS